MTRVTVIIKVSEIANPPPTFFNALLLLMPFLWLLMAPPTSGHALSSLLHVLLHSLGPDGSSTKLTDMTMKVLMGRDLGGDVSMVILYVSLHTVSLEGDKEPTPAVPSDQG